MENTHLNCPNCGQEINVNEIVYKQIQQKIKVEFGEKNALEKKEFEKKLRKEISDETASEIESYKEELSKKALQVKEFNNLKAQLEITKREKEELRETIEAESEQKLTQRLLSEKEKLRKELEEKNQFKVSEKEHIIEQLKNQLNEAQRKIEQGSMQLQGEVQEILLETYLKENFPLDIIEEIKKGARGADCLQIINSRERINCGSIYYESKRTKDFSNSWIPKFREDMQAKNATFGILVTDIYPKNIERMSLIDGVWVCKVDEFKGLCFVLREAALLLNNFSVSQENKGEKMQMLYDYLTGNEFRMQIEAIVEGFSTMQIDLNSEKRAMESIWKKRQKQIEKVLLNTSHMFNSVKGIAGNSVGEIKALELPGKNSIDE